MKGLFKFDGLTLMYQADKFWAARRAGDLETMKAKLEFVGFTPAQCDGLETAAFVKASRFIAPSHEFIMAALQNAYDLAAQGKPIAEIIEESGAFEYIGQTLQRLE